MDAITSTRPTAKNLFRAINRMQKASLKGKEPVQIARSLIDEAEKIQREEIDATREISRLGSELIPDGSTVLTHCNTGPRQLQAAALPWDALYRQRRWVSTSA